MVKNENNSNPLVLSRGKALRIFEKPNKNMFSNWWGYLWGPGLVALATILGLLEIRLFSSVNMMLFYLLCVVFTAVYWGLGPAFLVSFLSIGTQDYFFMSPYMSFGPPNFQDILSLLVLMVVSVITSYLAFRLRRKTEEAKRRELEAATLYAISRDLSTSTELESCIHTIIQRAKIIFGYNAILFLPNPENRGLLKPYSDNPNFRVDNQELSEATWSFQNSHEAGRNTANFINAKDRYFPLVTARGPVGVMALWNDGAELSLSDEQVKLLKTFSDLIAVTIENIHLAEQARHVEVLKTSEKLQSALLNSISHDLRTPLASVIGVLSSLQEEGMGLNEANKINLVQVAREEADRLNHLIGNLLDMSRIEGGAVRITRQSSDVADLIGVALEQLQSLSANHRIEINISTELPFVSVDFSLIVQVLVNILDNAAKYSPPGSIIDITGSQKGKEIEIEVADRGIGIPSQDLQHVFNKFYRVQRPGGVAGTGLGLAICKGFVEAHGGHIIAENRLGGGTIIRMTLPVAEPITSKEEGKVNATK